MHMADALVSPAVGGAMWLVSAGTVAYCSQKVGRELDDRKIPLMGVLGAFLFAAQMINFTIPATGSSGHLGGGLLMSILLGPSAAFLTIASVLVMQALFFADGGLLALGCNIFNIGFIPAFIVYPLVYRKIAGATTGQTRMAVATMLSAIIGLQLGPFGVVLETVCSGISALPFSSFLLLMQPIHLVIGIVEGLVTIAVVSFVYKTRPDILYSAREASSSGRQPLYKLVLMFLAAALFFGAIVSPFASRNPDGLEWAIARVTGNAELAGPWKGLHGVLAAVQQATAFLPDYSFKKPSEPHRDALLRSSLPAARLTSEREQEMRNTLGSSISGVLGAFMTLGLVLLCGFVLKRRTDTL